MYNLTYNSDGFNERYFLALVLANQTHIKSQYGIGGVVVDRKYRLKIWFESEEKMEEFETYVETCHFIEKEES